MAGAGPVGLTAALELARRGVRVRVVDPLSEAPRYAKAVGVQPRSLEASEQGWDPPPGALLPFVTAGIDVRYLRPSPLDSAVELRAVVIESAEPEIVCAAELRYDGKVRATGRAVWKRWRPRPS